MVEIKVSRRLHSGISNKKTSFFFAIPLVCTNFAVKL